MSRFAQIIAALDPAHISATEDERDLAQGAIQHRAAAVLIAITDCDEPGVILTQRPDFLRSHAGQVAFPGGKIDDSDADPIAAALREAHEELGLPAHQVQVIGTMDEYYTGSGYRITPVIGIVPPNLSLRANPDEVVDWFEVPLAHLLSPNNLTQMTALWQGQDRTYYEILWQDRRIWGVTAGIIANFAKRLDSAKTRG